MALVSRTIGNASDNKSITRKLLELLNEVVRVRRDSELTPEARQYADLVRQEIFDFLNRVIAELPESAEKRKAKRMVARVERRLPNARVYLENLTLQNAVQAERTEGAAQIFVPLVQSTLDMLHDSTQSVLHGVESNANAILLYWAVDELLAGFHLARCAFCTQANAHTRTVIEILDKVELFHQQPKWAEVWASGNESKAWNELRPASVRKKLGRVRPDSLFSHLSNHGSHATFAGAQRRTRVEKDDAGTRRRLIAIGGMRSDEERLFSSMGCIVAAGYTVLKAAAVLCDSLDVEETTQVTNEARSNVNKFLKDATSVTLNPGANQIEELIDFWQGVSR